MFLKLPKKLYTLGMEANASVVVVPSIWNLTTSHPFLAAAAINLRIFNCCVEAVTAVNPIVVRVKFITEPLEQIAVNPQNQTPRKRLQRNAQEQQRKGHDAKTEHSIRVVVVIYINSLISHNYENNTIVRHRYGYSGNDCFKF
jgi:hypothetical protein